MVGGDWQKYLSGPPRKHCGPPRNQTDKPGYAPLFFFYYAEDRGGGIQKPLEQDTQFSEKQGKGTANGQTKINKSGRNRKVHPDEGKGTTNGPTEINFF